MPTDRRVDKEAVIRAGRRVMPMNGSRQLAEKRLCFLKILCVGTLNKPAVDRCEQVAGFGAAALVAAERSEAHGGAQLPELGALLRGDAHSFAIQFLSGLGMPLPQQQPAFVPASFLEI